ncbi:acetate kinase [Allofrancisella guangzhouensis]|uniref:Acetate kinase n=1 Tax=Allofrancisella guangzhouensis TaxID=594679 RepID=A0A0A8E860_9GAMM|nr:acetate kinase [Allofrancisella guangzhouensis]AJC48346.1 acetate kinase [Allofrancisella guangzhouensis]MBK2026562.1 acetate kinase [Allofrancisella guangzhouensis]MBK2044306.1 acetate kinase [Allofrancisella guangzhouensis]MBK2045549.1 acetate kinase [Allofrancisella guangzhouensis]
MSHILVLNCGSSSVKFALIDPTSSKSLLTGLAENIGQRNCRIVIKADNVFEKIVENGQYKDIFIELKMFLEENSYLGDIVAVGHRVVHGGQYFSDSVVIDERALEKIKNCIPLAPLHNPANIEGITFCQQIFSNLPQVAVFDTAFHQTIPKYIAEYAIPRELTKKYHIKKYGFHGTSHKYVSIQAARLLGKDQGNFIVAHLGNGCSLSAIVEGKSIDISMGFTPLDGLIMGTRSGSIDSGIFDFLANNLGWNINKITTTLNKQSGLLGICGHSDMREISYLADRGDELARLAIEMFCHRIAKFVASYMVYFEKFDGLVFTGGIGENAINIRENIVTKLKNIGFKLNHQKNSNKESFINAPESHNIMIVNTNEELMIACETKSLI